MKTFFVLVLLLCFSVVQAQNGLSGMVEDARTHEALEGASITMYGSGGVLGGISNKEGGFFVNDPSKIDSIRISMIGYRGKLYKIAGLASVSFIRVSLEMEPMAMQEIVVHPLDAIDIVRQAAERIPSTVPPNDFASSAFYREIIRDSLRYYSVAEAIFDVQFSVRKRSFVLRLLRGRSKEDVAYTRLFEDFHPGGGPEDAVGQSFVTRRPDFLSENSLANYIYKKDSTIKQDERTIYVVGFDQRPGVHAALEKGKLYIDADDFSVLKFEAANSPVGTPYIKSLKGADKVFAEILHVDLAVRGWERTATYTKLRDKLFLSYAKMRYSIDYKQPKKTLDLQLLINTELMFTDFQRPIVAAISKGEEWKRKNLVANLPTDFDSSFWGANNILSPTEEIRNIIDSLSKKNNDVRAGVMPDGWKGMNKEFFMAYGCGDSIALLSLAKCSWEDNETGGMIYKEMEGDFNIEARLFITKRSDPSRQPDNGFQQSGIILRSATGKEENHIIFSMGTGGNDVPKYFLKRTAAGKTKGLVVKTDSLSGWLRMERRGRKVAVYRREDGDSSWTKVDDYELDWLKASVQVGFSIMARFAGDGPKQKPDLKAVFSNIKITGLPAN